MAEQQTPAVKKQPDYRDALAKANDNFLPMVEGQLAAHSIQMDGYQRQCAMNALSAIYTLMMDSGKQLTDANRSNLRQIIERVAVLRLNAYSQPREVYFQTRNKKQGDGWATLVEMGVEGDGNDAILRNFGVNVQQVYTPWLVREGDGFSYPKHTGLETTAPTWEPAGQGKVVRVVYPIKMQDGTVEYHIAERADVRRNLTAHVLNNLMNETFGLAESRYKATPEQKKKIDAKKAEYKALMKGKTLEELLDAPELEPYISPAWREPHSRESMIVRKMRNNAIKPIPKDFGSGYATSMYMEVEQEDAEAIFTEIREEENAGGNSSTCPTRPSPRCPGTPRRTAKRNPPPRRKKTTRPTTRRPRRPFSYAGRFNRRGRPPLSQPGPHEALRLA